MSIGVQSQCRSATLEQAGVHPTVRSKIVIGDVFEVLLDASSRRVFQYIADDATQLHSNVVRIFRQVYRVDEVLDPHGVILGDVEFHAHVLLPIGVKLKSWTKCGNAPVPRDLKVRFRDSSDYGNPNVKVSKDWFVWEIDGRHRDVGSSESELRNADIGVVVPPDSLVHRLRTGRYDFFYPDY